MPIKVFTTLKGQCPFGRGVDVDSAGCRNCQFYYMKGTPTFFWCMHPAKVESSKAPETGPAKPKRGRPPGKAQKKPDTASKTKK